MASIIKVDTIQDATGAFEHARLVQVVNVTDSAVATGSTTMNSDNTIPQITEGNEWMTLAITPTNASNKLFIEVVVQVASSSSTTHIPRFNCWCYFSRWPEFEWNKYCGTFKFFALYDSRDYECHHF